MPNSFNLSPTRRWARKALATAAIVGIFGTWVLAEEVTVNRNVVDVLKGKGSLYLPPLTTARRGEKLQVVGREGRWLKVRYNGEEGYVLEASLSGPDVASAAASASAGGFRNGSSDASAAAAAKGFGPDTYARSHGYSLDGLNKMKATRDRLRADPGRWEQFKAQGKVGVN